MIGCFFLPPRENVPVMDSLLPGNLLRYGYKDCVLCEVTRPGEEERCRNCSGRLGQRDRLLWEIRRERILRTAGNLSLIYPGLGHLYSGRIAYGVFWAALLPLSLGLVLTVGSGITFGHGFLLVAAGAIWWMAFVDARRGTREEVAPCESACPAHIRVPDYIALVREGRPLEALALVHDKLPFAAFCGRACPHPCEQECVRNEWGAPISIMAIKRYAADLGYAAGIPPSSEETGRGRGAQGGGRRRRRVGIVGRRHARAARGPRHGVRSVRGTRRDDAVRRGGVPVSRGRAPRRRDADPRPGSSLPGWNHLREGRDVLFARFGGVRRRPDRRGSPGGAAAAWRGRRGPGIPRRAFVPRARSGTPVSATKRTGRRDRRRERSDRRGPVRSSGWGRRR